jgi:hypothetical protein
MNNKNCQTDNVKSVNKRERVEKISEVNHFKMKYIFLRIKTLETFTFFSLIGSICILNLNAMFKDITKYIELIVANLPVHLPSGPAPFEKALKGIFGSQTEFLFPHLFPHLILSLSISPPLSPFFSQPQKSKSSLSRH